jgi:hypothetical protein
MGFDFMRHSGNSGLLEGGGLIRCPSNSNATILSEYGNLQQGGI